MSKVALKIEHYTSEELRSLLRKDEKYQQAIRLYACYQVSLGKRPQELESIYETSFKSICNWVNRLNEGGIEALIDKVKPGRNNRLTNDELQSIKAVLLNKQPDDYGFNSATWTGPLLIELIRKEYQVEYKKAQIYNILKKLGLTFQKGKGLYPEAQDREEKVNALKKTPGGSAS
ncbi:helix-turn-helix domain-containing protein [Mucilaginibacter sp. cycad4]|uniref:helix-turn-helix domain-containing protein n=1 Tax=Mucilaginibacter sp. cycad4 TaxID=3342096 RepID=UPI002AABB979|nr:helix-turn-helix domain-containing protein [Mucilaginibacter gossypii]WPV00705.1 helix-turn-helix domain-containing protein [Mucilaginibacter gossypii]WPV01095.1 helix-turn-helix domain-containing protein [Mucilaginibacter gossypii]